MGSLACDDARPEMILVWVLLMAAMALAYADVIRELMRQWSANDTYSFGVLVRSSAPIWCGRRESDCALWVSPACGSGAVRRGDRRRHPAAGANQRHRRVPGNLAGDDDRRAGAVGLRAPLHGGVMVSALLSAAHAADLERADRSHAPPLPAVFRRCGCSRSSDAVGVPAHDRTISSSCPTSPSRWPRSAVASTTSSRSSPSAFRRPTSS